MLLYSYLTYHVVAVITSLWNCSYWFCCCLFHSFDRLFLSHLVKLVIVDHLSFNYHCNFCVCFSRHNETKASTCTVMFLPIIVSTVIRVPCKHINKIVTAPPFFLCICLLIPVNISVGGATLGAEKVGVGCVKHKSTEFQF